MPEEVIKAIKDCDSWSDVEDQGDAMRHGRYAVTVFFDTEDDARAFHNAVTEINTR